jgi:ketosteroid isomerase-like protein
MFFVRPHDMLLGGILASVSEQADANRALIERFYAAFDRHDGEAMAACYAPNPRFRDPVFQELRGEEPGAMWRMLTGRAEDLRVELAARSTTTCGPASASPTA